MNKATYLFGALAIALVAAVTMPGTAQAAERTIEQGIYAGEIDLSGKTSQEAAILVQDYVDQLSSTEITLNAVNGNAVTVTASDLGLQWGNPQIIEEAIEIGKQGNIVQRYKALKSLEASAQIYPIELSFQQEMIETLLTEQCTVYDQPAVNAMLARSDGTFTVEEGQIGYAVDVTASATQLMDYLSTSWDKQPASIDLVITETAPQGDAATLSQVKDVLGTYTTTYKTSGSSRCNNIANGCHLIDGTTLYPGEQLSVLDKITPFTEQNGYYLAGSYLNGTVVESFGGGICQVSTTLYNAVLRAELQVDDRSNHSMIINYVQPSEDAAIAESGGKDFKFTNNLEYPIYIEGTISGKSITFTIYGVETRDASRSVEYESVVLETTVPTTDVLTADPTLPAGYVDITQSVHIGYKAQLWKIVKENGTEVSREQVNSSTYKAVPRYVTIGTATDDPNLAAQLQAAIDTALLDNVQAVLAGVSTGETTDNTATEDVNGEQAVTQEDTTQQEAVAQ